MRIALAIAGVVLTLGLVVNAQDTTIKSKSKTSGAQPQTVSYTGCVDAGTETRTFVLNKAVPVTRTTESIGTTGTTTTTETSYMLVPGPTVEVQEHVGHKVQVTGTLVPAGDSKTRSKTKIEREHAPDTTVKEKSKVDNGLPRFTVSSITDLGERCQ